MAEEKFQRDGMVAYPPKDGKRHGPEGPILSVPRWIEADQDPEPARRVTLRRVLDLLPRLSSILRGATVVLLLVVSVALVQQVERYTFESPQSSNTLPEQRERTSSPKAPLVASEEAIRHTVSVAPMAQSSPDLRILLNDESANALKEIIQRKLAAAPTPPTVPQDGLPYLKEDLALLENQGLLTADEVRLLELLDALAPNSRK